MSAVAEFSQHCHAHRVWFADAQRAGRNLSFAVTTQESLIVHELLLYHYCWGIRAYKRVLVASFR
jgi:hypothetical protein